MTLRWTLALALLLAPACALMEDALLPAPCDPPCGDSLVCNDLTGQCVDSICGNSQVEAAEGCDAGSQNSDITPGACRLNCTLPGCGDGVVDPGEACDDGNSVDGDYCSGTCAHDFGSCGDGLLSPEAGEACDDGNTTARDYCSADCKRTTGTCGDATRQKNERCDDGNVDADDYCSPDCQAVTGSCGDTLKQGNEVCDDGNRLGADYCSWNCQALTGSCGDGTLQVNEACDDGNLTEGDYCSPDCQTKTGSCGDGARQSNEVCDDGNDDNGDSCLSSCVCNKGYEAESGVCVDVNECNVGASPCDTDATCTNIPGSFQCGCKVGYSGDGVTCDADSALGSCQPGDRKDVDCNTCECVSGEWMCTDALCVATCVNNDDCRDDEFCQVPEGSCAEGEGTCAGRPEACTTNTRPVCGCDAKDYTTACAANTAGVNVASKGPCVTKPGECPDGSSPVSCLMNPCDLAQCASNPNAVCEADYCGGCNAVFYDHSGAVVKCDDSGGVVCPNGQVFSQCASACTPTCDDPTPICTKQCVARCECPADKPLWDDQQCITQTNCADNERVCIVDGQEYLPGDSTPPPAGQPACAACTCGDNATVKCDLSACSSCAADEDCQATHWCRPTQDGGRECTPYQQEGEPCDGYTPEWARQRCDPSLTCGGFNAQIPDLAGKCLRDDAPIICRQDGREYQSGDIFSGAGDNWCNCCSCSSNGQAVCTRMGCPELCADDSECPGNHWCRAIQPGTCSTEQSSLKTCTPFAREGEACGGYVAAYFRKKCEPGLDCVTDATAAVDLPGTCSVPEPSFCEPGTLGLADDQCNDCLCMEGGDWYCNDTACSKSCDDGDLKTSSDGCNQCSCSGSTTTRESQWHCTRRACTGCTPGESRLASDECNTCMCVPEGAPSKSNSPCAACLAEGGTWQPEANTCTTNCDIMDISCYREVCPDTDTTMSRWVCTDLPRCAEDTPLHCKGDAECADGFCRHAEGSCYGKGECAVSPGFCTEQWQPVCGCDGVTYGNTCEAHSVGVSVKDQGKCKDCPAATDFTGSCTQNIVWAMNPATGTCCSYPNPCVVPEGMGDHYGNEKACLYPHGEGSSQSD